LTSSNSRQIARSSFAIVANGFADGPAQALRDYLVERDARVVTVFHPLSREQGGTHVVAEYAEGRCRRRRTIHIPVRAPLSFALDPLVPPRLPAVDTWFGFNPLACARGLLARRLGRARRVVLWSVDFVPERFGRTPVTRLYDSIDRLCCRRADARVELSVAARDARNHRHGLNDTRTPTYVVPMGAWVARTPTVGADAVMRRRVVFLGHLVPRQGVSLLLEALALLHRRGTAVEADVIGGGPLTAELRALATRLGIDELAHFHGFVEDHRRVEELLARGSIAVAPYDTTPDSFSRYADPGKLKAYLAAGLPIVLTPVPPVAAELAETAGAELVSFDAQSLADAIEHGLETPERWQERHEAALSYASRFDWDVLLRDALASLGFDG
jgi:glycosyltransferase involved in cell wall biosynthesis